jgi:Zn ribbon nucleic-acid-binding protein
MFLRHTACPVCPSSDALAIYEDGSQHCFSCGHHKHGNGLERLKTAPQAPKQKKYRDWGPIAPEALEWLNSYDLTEQEKMLFKYDRNHNHLCYEDGDFLNARNFGEGPKYLSEGPKPYSPLGYGVPVVLVEDIISAIKVSRVTACMCLFGSSIPLEKVRSTDIVIWLDFDKAKESMKTCKTLIELGFNCRSLVTELDPKCYDTQEIQCILGLGHEK